MKKISILLMLMALFGPLAMNAQQTATFNNGTTTSSYVPFYGGYADYGAKGQFIIPASDLANNGIVSGCQISKLTFYNALDGSGTAFGTSRVVEVGEVSNSTFSSTSFVTTGLITVLSGNPNTMTVSGGTMEVSFSSNYTYSGGNLVISIGGYGSECFWGNWYGVEIDGASVYGYNQSSGVIPTSAKAVLDFAPKTTITYIPGSGNPITLNQPANGTISVSVNGGTASTNTTYAEAGQSVTLTATANSGYTFDSWNVTGVNGTANGSTYTFTMPDNAVTVTANFIPTSGGTNTTTVWERATSISTSETYLIGAVSGSDVYLVLNYSPNTSNHYYYSSGSNYWGYTAKATLDGDGHVIGCTGNATDLQYAQWTFSTTSGGTITSNYESGRYLYGTTSNSWTDLYPNTSYTSWTYSNNKLSYSSSNYLYLNTSYYVQKGSSSNASTVYLYKPATVTTYAITATASPAAGGTVSGLDYYASGATCTLTATPNADYVFVNWTENGNVVSTDATYTFTVSSARTLVANFTTLGAYHITCNTTTGGTISASPTAADENALITITATPNPGYELTALSYNDGSDHDITFSNNQGTFTMPAHDVTVSATFTAINYTVTCATGLTGGSISASPTTNVHYGDQVTITATPDNGYELAAITATDANNNEVTVTIDGNTGTFSMPASNVTVTAVFTKGFNVIVEQTANGTVTANPTTMLHSGDIVNLTATPDTDCVLLAWYVYKTGDPRAVISVVNNSFFFMPASDVTVQAIFVTQEEVNQQIGSGTSTEEKIPTYVGNAYSLTQQIYLASELNNQKGTITKIAYRATTASATRNLDIYIRHTDQSAFTSTTNWTTMGPSFRVFRGNVTFSTSDWTTITLDTPFEYDGTSNIIICVVDNTGSTASNITQFYRYSATDRALCASGSSEYTYVNVSNITEYTGELLSYVNRINLTMLVPGSAESLTISPDEISDFSYVEGQGPSNIAKFGIVGVDLQNDITVTAPTNFEICLTEDGTYDSSLTIPRETSKRGRNVTTWNFDSDLENWTTFDADGDGYNWYRNTSTDQTHNESAGGVTSASYQGVALTPDNWLISPQVELGGTFSIWASPQDPAWPQEHFGIFVSTTNTQTSSFIMLNEWTCDAGVWKQYSVDLSGFAGQTGYIAVRHFNCTDLFRLNVDDFELDTEATLTIEMPVVITPATVFVRMKDNLIGGTYTGTLTAKAGTSNDAPQGSLSLSGEVIFPSFTLDIEAWGSGTGWYLIASPIGEVNPNAVKNMITDDLGSSATTANATYDLYAFNQNQSLEWQNYRNNDFNLLPGQGYLYANADNVTLVFTGSAYDGEGEFDLTYSEQNGEAYMHGWNLLGNPYPVSATINDDFDFMQMRSTHDEIIVGDGNVEAMEGIFVHATEEGQSVTFTPNPAKTTNVDRIMINISQDQKVIDRAIVRFGEGNQLPKFQLNENSTKIYFPVEGEDFAVVRSEGIGELPVSFKAEENGNYTLSLNANGVNFGYLHLIDNMTGNDVDMLVNPSYSFESRTSDYSHRFKLVFATGDNTNDTFAYFSNGSFVINNDGKATLQVIDITGRILKSESINGCANLNFNAAPGVYMIRLVNGTDVKVQKVVVK